MATEIPSTNSGKDQGTGKDHTTGNAPPPTPMSSGVSACKPDNDAANAQKKRPHDAFEWAGLIINGGIFFATFSAAIFAAGAACIFWRQLGEMQTANIEVHKNFVADERAWLKIDADTSAGYQMPDGTKWMPHLVRLTITNTGKTPAFFVSFDFNTTDAHVHDAATEQRKRCNKWLGEKAIADHPDRGPTLFPGQSMTLEAGAELSPDEVKAAKSARASAIASGKQNLVSSGSPHERFRYYVFENNPEPMPMFYGCINYKTAFGAEWHQTGFVYDIESADTVPAQSGKRVAPDWAVYSNDSANNAFFAN